MSRYEYDDLLFLRNVVLFSAAN